jgi:hypothetical protein
MQRQAADAAFVGLLLLGAAIVLYETRGFSFYFDDWDFVLDRRGVSASVLLTPHGPHLVLVPILIYKILLAFFGGSSYLPFRFLAALDLVAMALALGLVTRRAWGPWWGLAPVLLLVTLGSGGWTILWSFQVGYAIANVAGLGALVALSRGGRYDSLLACGALVLSLASGSQGLGYLVGAAIVLALRGDWRRNAWTVAVPAVLYGLWYLKYGHQASETQLALWRDSLPYTMLGFSATISGLLGLGSPSNDLPPRLDPSFGQPVALAALIALAIGLVRGWRPPRLFWAVVATLVTLWLATSLSNIYGARQPTDSRYLSTNAMLLLVCVCITLPRPRLRRNGTVAAVAILVVIAATNAGQFTAVRNQMLATSVDSRAQLGTLLIMRGLVPAGFSPAPPFTAGLVNDVQAGPFYSAYDKFGLPVDSPVEILEQDEGTRELADQAFARGEEVGYEFSGTPQASHGLAPRLLSGQAPVRGGCLLLTGRSVSIEGKPGPLQLTSTGPGGLTTSVGRFAGTYDIPLGVVPSGRTAVIRIPADGALGVPWRILVGGDGRVCTISS